MASALIIPGVQVKAEFAPAPVLPGATGILGLVGVADRGPLAPTAVGSFGELLERFGPATRYTMPEARTALSNGVMQIVVARIAPGRGRKATLTLTDDDGEPVVVLEARAEGAWAARLAARVTQVRTLDGSGVKYVNLELLIDGKTEETLSNLTMNELDPNNLFDRINLGSRLVVAIDSRFEKQLPAAQAPSVLAELPARASAATLRAGASDVVRVTAKKTGRAGDLTSIRVRDGSFGLALGGAGIAARKPGPDGRGIRVSVTSGGGDSVNLVISTVVEGTPVSRTLGPFADLDALVAGVANDPDVTVAKNSNVLPAVMAATALARRVDIVVNTDGAESRTYPGIGDLAGITAISDPIVDFALIDGAAALPDANDGVPLAGGRGKGRALQLGGDAQGGPALLELQPAPGAPSGMKVEIIRGVSSEDSATAVAGLSVFVDDALNESFADLTMDPDDPNYLPAVLAGSTLLRAFDLIARSRTTSMPGMLPRAQAFTGGVSPLVDDYQDAIDRLEGAEQVDLVIASVANQLGDAGVRAVHKAVVAHCIKMADPARNRIGLGSVTIAETSKRAGRVAAILDHADDVRSDAFVLTAPAGSEAAVAGLISLQDYFQSPTFKAVPNLGVPAGDFSDAELTALINGNVLVVNKKRKLGDIVVKGVLTSGRQINVQRTANKAVRDVKAIAEVYIGLLNNDGNRNALRQQIIALFEQMFREGALVPSVDGTDPPYKVSVYSTQADFANGIVRIDIAIRPVRAIDFVYATLLVQN